MKKFTTISLLVGSLFQIQAAEAAIPVTSEASKEFYRPREFQIDAFGGLVTPDLDKERSHVGFGVNYFLTRNLGVGASTSFENLDGQFFDNIAMKGLFRAPIGRYAFGAYAGVGYQFEAEEWSLILGPTFETRFTPNISWFVQIGMAKQFTGEREIGATAQTGIRYSF